MNTPLNSWYARWMALSLVGLIPATLAQAQDEEIDFEKQIWPFLERSCVKCHKAPFEENGKTIKPKAGLRMDGAWAFKAGSENGSVMEAGNAKESEIWWRTDLPTDDDDFMPPTDKADPLSPEEKELFKKWIDQGADFGEWVGNLEGKPKEVSNTGEKLPVSEIQETYTKLSEGLAVPKEDMWKEVTAAGGRVMPLATESPLLSVDFRLVREEADDAKVATIAKIGEHIAQLDLSKTSVTDAGLAPIEGLKRVVRLDLNQTGITDAGLSHLKGLENLNYLNLYGTGVTDAGLKQLESIKSLKNVYLWEAKVTDKGVKSLQKALPEAKIVWK
ncbi:MAG: hypothetical protein KDN20_20840 [Verrucomicrobiae bacterium]|nr:hypothetical protein [Verrucomicrobiae bacterium]